MTNQLWFGTMKPRRLECAVDIKLTPEQKVLLKTAREAKEAALKALQEAQTAYVGAQQRVLEEHGYIPGLVVGVGKRMELPE